MSLTISNIFKIVRILLLFYVQNPLSEQHIHSGKEGFQIVKTSQGKMFCILLVVNKEVIHIFEKANYLIKLFLTAACRMKEKSRQRQENHVSELCVGCWERSLGQKQWSEVKKEFLSYSRLKLQMGYFGSALIQSLSYTTAITWERMISSILCAFSTSVELVVICFIDVCDLEQECLELEFLITHKFLQL